MIGVPQNSFTLISGYFGSVRNRHTYFRGGSEKCGQSGQGFEVAGGPRGATPHSRSGGVAVRRYPSSKVRSSGCALLEQP